MKKKFGSLILVLLIGILIFAGCGFQPLKNGPSLNAPVTSNGGLAVQKGGYLYFVNGYINTGDLTSGANAYGEVQQSALYRAKLNSENELMYDDDGNLTEVGVLAPKIVGFENGGFYIFDNTIYYATPNTEKNSSGTVIFTLTDFYSSNLDGTNVNRLYKTTVSSTAFKFAFYKIQNTVYLAVYDSANLIIVNTSNKSVKKVAEGVSAVAFPKVTEYVKDSSSNYTLAEQYVYYTRSAVEEDNVDNGNILAMAKLVDAEEIIVSSNATYAVKEFKNDNLIYTRQGKSESNEYYYLMTFQNGELDKNTETKLTFSPLTNPVYAVNFQNGNYRGLVVINSEGYLTLINPTGGGLPSAYVLNSQFTLTILAVQDNYVYCYDENKQLVRVSYTNYTMSGEQRVYDTVVLTDNETDTLSFDMAVNFDSTGRFVYCYKSFTGKDESENDVTGLYLVRIDTTAGEPETQLVGVLEDKHTPVEEEEE